MDDLGRTEELTVIRLPTPDRSEADAQKIGRWCFRGGASLAIATYSLALISALLTGNNLWNNAPDAHLFALLGLVTLACLSTALVLIGGLERLQRPIRLRQLQNTATLATAIDRNRRLLEQMSLGGKEQIAELMGLVAAVPHRISGVEDALQALVSALPEEIQRRYWEGFNDAVREGFRATGTDGDKKLRPPYIGLVPRDSSNEDPS